LSIFLLIKEHSKSDNLKGSFTLLTLTLEQVLMLMSPKIVYFLFIKEHLKIDSLKIVNKEPAQVIDISICLGSLDVLTIK